MMISPEGYYEEYLKGKKAAQIMTAIRGLKKEIGHLKNTMEHPDYGEQPIVHPSESTRLWCTRLYLERATAINNGIKYLKEISLASRAGSKKSGR